MLLLLATEAWAFILDDHDPILVPEVPISVAVAQRPEGLRLIVAGTAGTHVMGLDGAELATLAPSVVALPYDVDSDGFDDLLTCGSGGLQQYAWSGVEPASAYLYEDLACSALGIESFAGSPGVAVASDGAIEIWVANGAGGFDGPTTTELEVTGTVRLGAMDSKVAAASVGDTTLGELGNLGVSDLALGGVFADVLPGAGSWLVALSDAQVVRDLAGGDIALGAEPVRLMWADLDVDGRDELVILEVGQVEVVAGDGSGSVTGALPGAGDSIVALDVDGDGCPDLVVSDATLPQLDVLRTGLCPLSPDGDGDGYSVSDGDCDDSDSGVHPGADDACNRADDDCDGVVDEPGSPVLVGLDAVPEGDSFLAWATTDGCDPDLTWTWTDPSSALATCVVVGAEIDCTALDDGELPLRVEATSSDGAVVYTIDDTLMIQNVDPSMTLPGFLEDGELVMDIGQDYTGTLSGSDPGTDTITFSATGGPDSFQVSPTGNVTINALQRGTWDIRIAVNDEDGGETAVDITYEVTGADDSGDTSGPLDGEVGYSGGCDDSDPGQGGCSSGLDLGCGGCCGGSGLAWVFIGGWGLRRRRANTRS